MENEEFAVAEQPHKDSIVLVSASLPRSLCCYCICTLYLTKQWKSCRNFRGGFYMRVIKYSHGMDALSLGFYAYPAKAAVEGDGMITSDCRSVKGVREFRTTNQQSLIFIFG